MPVYTVHAPARADRAMPDRFVFVRDGFHVWAMLGGGFWLILNRLWLALLGYLVLSLAMIATLVRLGAGGGAVVLSLLLLALLLGLEGATLKRWSFSRGRWRQVGTVVADTPEMAERRFFDRWTNVPARRLDSGSDRGAPPPSRGAAPAYATPLTDVIGLFPDSGAQR